VHGQRDEEADYGRRHVRTQVLSKASGIIAVGEQVACNWPGQRGMCGVAAGSGMSVASRR
jgi:hypothetical protein